MTHAPPPPEYFTNAPGERYDLAKSIIENHRDHPFAKRLHGAQDILLRICREQRAPRMSIPVQESDEDVFIYSALGDADEYIRELEGEISLCHRVLDAAGVEREEEFPEGKITGVVGYPAHDRINLLVMRMKPLHVRGLKVRDVKTLEVREIEGSEIPPGCVIAGVTFGPPPMMPQDSCTHDRSEGTIEVHKITAKEGGPVTHYSCDFKLRCVDCDIPYHFIGFPMGMSFREPSISVDGTEARLPVAPGRLAIPYVGRARIEALIAEPPPIPMVLHCPNCGAQHVDEPETEESFKTRHTQWFDSSLPEEDRPVRWTNPPHKSHLCHECGTIWRPADVPTNGVATIATHGSRDTWLPEAPKLTDIERRALDSLNRYGPAEDCRQSNETVEAYIALEQRGLVKRNADETYITDAGRKVLSEQPQ